MLVRCVGLREQAAGEDDTGDLLLEQKLHVVRLGHAAPGLRAQHGRQPLLGQSTTNDLGERREDRILQLGEHQPTSRARSPRSWVGRSYPSTSRAVRTD